MSNRRAFLQRTLSIAAALAGSRALPAQQMPGMTMPMPELAPKSRPTPPLPQASNIVPVITPDVGDLPYILDGQTKVFRLIAEPVKQPILPGPMGKTLDLWGFNGTSPGPTIQVTEGDHVRILFENHLPEPTSMHWHGFEDSIPNDGMPGISQLLIPPGGTYTYEFHIHQTGTFFYHSHMAMQEMAGMLGGFIMHPKAPHTPHCDKDFLIHLQEYFVLPTNTTPNTMNMEFNWLLLNGKAGPATTPLIVRQGDRVRIRFVNLGMDHHPMHLHGNTFHTTGTEAGRIPPTAWWPGNTVLVGVAQARDIEFNATNPGDWMLHCHLPHHMMNQMSSNVGPMTRTADDRTSDGPLTAQQEPSVSTMKMLPSSIAPNANSVPNFPQDAFMETPAMAMDSLVDRPENHGLRPGWSAYMMGMMNLVRVLPPPLYDEITTRMRQAARPNDPYAPLLQREERA